MKTRLTIPRLPVTRRTAMILAGSIAALFSSNSAQAASYGWNLTTTPASWSLNTNWTGSPPTGGPSGISDFDTINTNIGADATINIFNTGDAGTAQKTLGRLDIGDTDGSHKFTIAAGTGGGSLLFDNNGSGAIINELSTSKSDTISAPIVLNDDLTLNNASGNVFTLSSATAITSTGTRNITLNAAAAGGITVNSANNTGTITNSSLGAGAIAVNTIGSNVTGLTQSSTAGASMTNSVLNVASGGTTVTNNSTVSKVITLKTVQGTLGGTLFLVNNSTATGNTLQATATGGINHNGAITNTGSGVNAITNIAVDIGSSVGLITQNSSGSMSLSGTNTNINGVALQSGTLSLGSTTALGATASTLTISGGSLNTISAGISIANSNAQVWNSDFGFTATGALRACH